MKRRGGRLTRSGRRRRQHIHKGSAESKDSDEKMEAALRRIEVRLGTLPGDAPTKKSES
ncbi:MAG: hypothetical protein ACRDZ9_07390 [Acidimicrobiales bacterium]